MNFETTLYTAGDGFWSTAKKAVRTTRILVNYVNEEEDFGELVVYFNTDDWDVAKDGLIYTDSVFLSQLKEELNTHNLYADDVSYSEQGMQDYDYVSLDVGKEFLDSYKAINGEFEFS